MADISVFHFQHDRLGTDGHEARDAGIWLGAKQFGELHEDVDGDACDITKEL